MSTQPPDLPNAEPNQERLSSWKEIGAYLQRNEATARRWEREEGLPVHRHSHKVRSSVYAFPGELDAWRARRRVPPEPPPSWRNLFASPRAGAFVVTILACVLIQDWMPVFECHV